MKRLLLFLCVFGALSGHSQQTSYTIEPGQTLSDVLGNGMYRYPEFRSARVQFRDGYVKAARMNLNYLLGGLEFINPKGDTLALEGISELAHVAIGTDTFFFYGGALEQVGSWKGVGRLLVRRVLRETGSSRIGGYEANDPAGATEAVTRYNANNQVRSLAVRERTTFVKEEKLYFWKDDTSEPTTVDRRALEKLFPGKKAQLDETLRSRKINLKKPEEVRNLIQELLAS